MNGIIYIILSCLITIVLFLFSKIESTRTIELWTLLAQISGLLGSVLISWNFLISTRNKVVEKMFDGLDKAYKIHNIVGNIAFMLVVNHPVFLIISALPRNTSNLYLIPSLDYPSYAFGILALYTLIILISLTIFLNVPYKLWKKTHEYMGLVILFASIHGLLISSDISVYMPLKIWVLSCNAIAIVAYIYKRFLYYIYTPKNNYTVSNIKIDKDYLLLDLKATNPNNNTNFKPGQFAFFSFNDDVRDEHPFSIVEQNNDVVKFGSKTIGNFTTRLSNVKVGEKINVYGPFGTFSSTLNKPKKMIWLSGGIGITPFLSMIKLIRPDQEVVMIHTTRSDESTLFTDMCKEYALRYPNFKFDIHYSDKLGHIDENIINSYMNLDREVYVYLCGPKLMMESLSTKLANKGVMHRKIIFEDFSLK